MEIEMRYSVYRCDCQKIIYCVQENLSNPILQRYWIWLEDREYDLSDNGYPHYEGFLSKKVIKKDIYKEGYILLFLEDE